MFPAASFFSYLDNLPFQEETQKHKEQTARIGRRSILRDSTNSNGSYFLNRTAATTTYRKSISRQSK